MSHVLRTQTGWAAAAGARLHKVVTPNYRVSDALILLHSAIIAAKVWLSLVALQALGGTLLGRGFQKANIGQCNSTTMNYIK